MNLIEHLDGLLSGQLTIIKMVFSIAKLEARLAGLSIFPLFLTMVLLLTILMSTWLGVMLLLGLTFALLIDNFIAIIALVLFVNVGFFILLLSYLSFNLKKMSFERTRAYFSDRERHDKQKKTVDKEDCNDGKKIKTSAT